MAIEGTPETFDTLTQEGCVLVDFWGPNCAPCLAHMPAIEEIGAKYGDRIEIVKVNSGMKENRPIAWGLKVMGLPTYVTMRDGTEIERLTGGDVTISQIEAAVERLLAD